MALPEFSPTRMVVLLNPEPELVTAFIAQLAVHGAVCLVDGCNRFNAYSLARALRHQTPHLEEALGRITIARAFTCYQMVSLLAQTPAQSSAPQSPAPMATSTTDGCAVAATDPRSVQTVPTLVLDVLATFTDESVDVAESKRLLRLVIGHLHRMPQSLSACAVHPSRNGLLW